MGDDNRKPERFEPKMYRKKLNSARERARLENRETSGDKIVPRLNLFGIERDSKIAVDDEIKRNTPFIYKLWQIVSEENSSLIAKWSPRGDTVLIDPSKTQSLKTYFKTDKIASFIRQLNTYGFQKKMCYVDNEDILEFHNEHFKRDHPQLLNKIERRVRKNQHPPTDNHTKSEADFEARILALEERVHSCENKLRMYEQLFGNLLEQGLKRSHLPDLNGAPFKVVRNDEEDEESDIDHGNTRIEELSGRNNISVNCRTAYNIKEEFS